MVDKRHHESIAAIWNTACDQLHHDIDNTDPPWLITARVPYSVIKVHLANFFRHHPYAAFSRKSEQEVAGEWTCSVDQFGEIYLAGVGEPGIHLSIKPPKDGLDIRQIRIYWQEVLLLFTIWFVQEQYELQPPSDKHTTAKQPKATPKKRAYAKTFDQVSKAARWRQDEINNHGRVPPRTGPNGIRVWCGVDETTVRDHASELWKHWKEKDYVWDNKLDKDEED